MQILAAWIFRSKPSLSYWKRGHCSDLLFEATNYKIVGVDGRGGMAESELFAHSYCNTSSMSNVGMAHS